MAGNNNSGKYTYLKMGEVGLDVKDFPAVYQSHTAERMNNFVEKDRAFGAQADAAAKATDKAAAVDGEMSIDSVTIYQITEPGLSLQATSKDQDQPP